MFLLDCSCATFDTLVNRLFSPYDQQVQLVTFDTVHGNITGQMRSHNQDDAQYASELEIS